MLWLRRACREKAEIAKEKQKEDAYVFYCNLMNEDSSEKVKVALKYFEANRGYKDCSEKASECRRNFYMLQDEESIPKEDGKSRKDKLDFGDILEVAEEISNFFG